MASRQAKAMRYEHMTEALAALRRASGRLEEARSWLFYLDHMPFCADVAKAKTDVERVVAQLSRQFDQEFPDELAGER